LKNQINIFNTTKIKPIPRKKILAIANFIIEDYKVSSATINIVLQTNEEIKKINKEFLNHDYETDVISFNIEEEPFEGELYISLEKTIEQAKEFDQSINDELLRLVAHGLLHLMGLDDDNDEQKEKMHKLEDYYIFKTKKS
jgi:rRNA maturation RNase YbeY